MKNRIEKEFKKLSELKSFRTPEEPYYFIIGAQRALDWVLNDRKRSPSEIVKPLIKESKCNGKLQREIKFRTFDFKNNRMLDGIRWDIVGIDKVWLTDPKGILNSTFEGQKIFTQFTGLTDKNGKEIYEGDIVRVWNYLNGKPWVGHIHECLVIFERCSFRLQNAWHGESLIDSELEILGNKFENPELLEAA